MDKVVVCHSGGRGSILAASKLLFYFGFKLEGGKEQGLLKFVRPSNCSLLKKNLIVNCIASERFGENTILLKKMHCSFPNVNS